MADLLVLLVGLPWLVYAVLIVWGSGTRFFRLQGNDTGRREMESVRDMGLTFAGLMFAGLAISLATPAPPASASLMSSAADPLVVGLACALVAWTVTNFGAHVWVAYLSGALITMSVGAVLVAVAEIAGRLAGGVADDALAVSLAAVAGLSAATARKYWRASIVATPRAA